MFRFTIRDVLWLTVVVAVTLALLSGWWERSQLAKALVAANDELRAEHGKARMLQVGATSRIQ